MSCGLGETAHVHVENYKQIYSFINHSIVCADCGEILRREPHEFGDWEESIAPICTYGLERRTCPCGYEQTSELDPGHTPSTDFRASDDGNDYYYCVGCDIQLQAHESETVDFFVDVEEGRPIRVLQLSDTQITDANYKLKAFTYISDAISRTDPDLIILTGDLIYGKFDNDGAFLVALADYMDSFEIPWAPVYGNHDNESQMGAKWQNAVLAKAEYCLFKKGSTDGNGNYTVGIRQGGELVRVFYMMDSNYCWNAYNASFNDVFSRSHGFTENQLRWLYATMERITTSNGNIAIPSSMAFHIPTEYHVAANAKYTDQAETFILHETLQADKSDFGAMGEQIKTPFSVNVVDGKNFLNEIKKYGVDSMFCGHSHLVNTSIMYSDIRWTFGLKTGTYDRYTRTELGGTSILIHGDNLSVSHVYYDKDYHEY